MLYLDFDGDSIPNRTFAHASAPERVLIADMDGDGLADIVTYRAGVWTVDFDQDGVPDATYYFGGAQGDVPLLGDVDGDGRVDLVIYRNGVWYTSTRRDGVADRIDFFGGEAGDIPMLGDLDCDGVAERIIYRAGVWHLQYADGASVVFAGLGGDPSDVPFVADWDGDCNARHRRLPRRRLVRAHASPHGKPDPVDGVVRRGRRSAARRTPRPRADLAQVPPPLVAFRDLSSRRHGVLFPDAARHASRSRARISAMTATHALAGDLDGNGKSSLILYNAGFWLVDRGIDGTVDEMYAFGGAARRPARSATSTATAAPISSSTATATWFVSTARDGSVALRAPFRRAINGDIPVLADVDGDGRADFGIYRDGIWYFDTKRDGTPAVTYVLGGAPGDVPLVADWNGDGKPDLVIYRGGEWFVSTDPASGASSIRESFGTALRSPGLRELRRRDDRHAGALRRAGPADPAVERRNAGADGRRLRSRRPLRADRRAQRRHRAFRASISRPRVSRACSHPAA